MCSKRKRVDLDLADKVEIITASARILQKNMVLICRHYQSFKKTVTKLWKISIRHFMLYVLFVGVINKHMQTCI